MLKGYKILTVTHRHTNLKNIAGFVIQESDPQALRNRLEIIKQQFELDELLYVATCNRVLYFAHTTKSLNSSFVSDFFRHINPTLSDKDITNAALYESEAAISHLYEVAASIDSMVVGEREILRQLREGYDKCQAWGLTGDYLRLAFQCAVLAAKDVYSNTRIGEKPVSVVSLAIEKLLQTNIQKDARILMIGAGQTNTLVTKFLLKHQLHHVTVFNRSLDKAQEMASLLGGRALPLHDLKTYQEGFDCLIVCTGANQPVVNRENYEHLLAGETGVKTVIDLSIPHNVAEEVVSHFPVYYIEIEGLRSLARENMSFREQETEKARLLLENHIADFHLQYRQRRIEKAMHRVPDEIKAVKQHAMNVVFKKELDTLDDDTRGLLEQMLTYMEKQCISIPMKAAKASLV